MARRTIRVASLDPVSGERIEVEQVLDPVGGFDFVFSAPKSISLVAALAEGDVRDAVLAAHHAAVRSALGLLEREACGVRLGAGGAARAKGSGIVTALYVHRTSRERDPHLHTHCAIGNVTQGPDGRWRTLDSRLLLCEWKLTLGYAYQAALRAEIGRRVGWAFHAPEKGLAELAAWPEPVLREFSTRRQRIEEALAEHGASSWQAGQIATLATRGRKSSAAVDPVVERAEWQARAAEHGLDRATLASLLQAASAPIARPTEAELRAIAATLGGPTGLTAKANTFRRSDVIRAFAGALTSGARVEQLEALADWFLADTTLAVPLDDEAFTAPDLLACEEQILGLVDRGRRSRTAVLTDATVERGLRRTPVRLSEEQERVVRAITQSGHAIENLEAVAGSGKTTVCGAIATAYRSGGYEVIGATPTARAARELSTAGVPADTIDGILTRLRARSAAPPRQLVVLIDEAGMAGTRGLAELVGWARSGQAKVIQVGDSHQLAGVPASGAFAAITRRHGAETLSEVRRQRDPAEVAALAALRAGDAETYVAHKIREGTLRIVPGAERAVADAAGWWRSAAAEHGANRVAVVTRTNELRARINAAVRRELVATEAIVGPVLTAPSGDLQRGDRVICRHNDRAVGVDNGTTGTIVFTNPGSGGLSVRTDDGRRVEIPRAYVNAGHVEHAYALTAHNLQGATLETVCVVARPDDHETRWTYTASTRARGTTEHVVIDDPSDGRAGVALDVVARLLDNVGRDRDDALASDLAVAPTGIGDAVAVVLDRGEALARSRGGISR